MNLKEITKEIINIIKSRRINTKKYTFRSNKP
jgi:hypothetical protein